MCEALINYFGLISTMVAVIQAVSPAATSLRLQRLMFPLMPDHQCVLVVFDSIDTLDREVLRHG